MDQISDVIGLLGEFITPGDTIYDLNRNIIEASLVCTTWRKAFDANKEAISKGMKQFQQNRELSCGASHTACILEDRTLYTFGYERYGQLGHGNNTENQLVPKKVESISLRVLQISCGDSHTACILEDRTLWTFGYGQLGELGHGNNDDIQLVPKKVESISLRVLQVSCGDSHTACILEDETPWTFGYGRYGQLGHGNNTETQFVPKKVESILYNN